MEIFRKIVPRKIDWLILGPVAFLLTTSLVTIYSLSLTNTESEGLSNFQRQGMFLFFAFIFFLFFTFIDYRSWLGYSRFFYITGILLMLTVLFFGEKIRGTTGWFSFGSFHLQPVELMKIFLIITLAKYFSLEKNRLITWRVVGVSLIYALIPMFLAAWQPDLGSVMVMSAIWLGMIFLAGLEKKKLGLILLLGAVCFLFSWGTILKDYQKERIKTFLNPSQDPLGSGYNVIQSMVAIGSGGVGGKGLGYGSQSQLNFLPEKHNDFIFAALGEETGLVGVGLVLFSFGLIFWRLAKTAQKSGEKFGRLLTLGVLIMLFFQLTVNVGMNLGVMPVAGISLPFLSYGGSFLVATMIALGLTQSVYGRG